MATRRILCIASRRLGGDLTRPCFGMDEALNPRHTKSGLSPLVLTRIIGNKTLRSRMLVAVYSGKHRKRGLVLNFCPFCGTRIHDAKWYPKSGATP